jgi:flagellar biosynthesis protein FlhB
VNESSGDKRYDATPGRRERARREGNVARSSEFVGITAFGGALIATAIAVPPIALAAAAAIRAGAADPFHPAAAALLAVVAGAMLPVLAAAAAATFVALAQSGGLHLVALKVAFDKLAPGAGLKRMFGGEAVVGAARATLAFATVAAVVIPLEAHVVTAAGALAAPVVLAQIAGEGALQACAGACAAGALFAAADYALAFRRWLRGLRMSFDELKRDAKEHDGDPQAKSRRKQFHRTLARGAIGRTREASFVVVNPTHVAIALRYAPPAVDVPEILVRAADAAALAVRTLAERERIPIVENAALARLLFRTGEAGRAIPTETFVAVAEVIAALVREGVLVA